MWEPWFLNEFVVVAFFFVFVHLAYLLFILGIYEIFSKEVFGIKVKNLEFGLQPHKVPDTETVSIDTEKQKQGTPILVISKLIKSQDLHTLTITSKFAQSTRDMKGFYLNRESKCISLRQRNTSLMQLLQTCRLYLGNGVLWLVG